MHCFAAAPQTTAAKAVVYIEFLKIVLHWKG